MIDLIRNSCQLFWLEPRLLTGALVKERWETNLLLERLILLRYPPVSMFETLEIRCCWTTELDAVSIYRQFHQRLGSVMCCRQMTWCHHRLKLWQHCDKDRSVLFVRYIFVWVTSVRNTIDHLAACILTLVNSYRVYGPLEHGGFHWWHRFHVVRSVHIN